MAAVWGAAAYQQNKVHMQMLCIVCCAATPLNCYISCIHMMQDVQY